MAKRHFPKDFLWGASTAAHQVEGNTHNQWSEWEQRHAFQLAAAAPDRFQSLPNWPIIQPLVTKPENYLSAEGAAHYTRYKEDFALLKQLNLNAFRFSIEWSRLEPTEGEWDEAAFTHYRDYLAALQAAGVEPIMTFWHWTIPTWFTDRGGFSRRRNVRFFSRFVQKVTEAYGSTLHYVLTINEPNVYTAFSYLNGEWPPQTKNPATALSVYLNLVQAHREAHRIIKRLKPTLQVGMSMNLADSRPKNAHSLVSRLVAFMADYFWNRWFLNRIRRELDFIGVNYYFTNYYQGVRVRNPAKPINDMGWYMEPSGLARVLETAWRHYRLPLMVTENGLADANDESRQWWLEQSLEAMQQAVDNGVDLRGYLHWSLLDNFEWSSGWWPKFGLVAVDRRTMKRTVRPSARWLAKQIVKG